jgi:hypothetical protein
MIARNPYILDLIKVCGETAKEKGFHDAHHLEALQALRGYYGIAEGPNGIQYTIRGAECPDVGADKLDDVLKVVCEILSGKMILGDPTIFLALAITELCEAIEAYRKGNIDGKDGAIEEVSDALIRLFDFIWRFSKKFGTTNEKWVRNLQEKMEFNKQRPHRHGKGF